MRHPALMSLSWDFGPPLGYEIGGSAYRVDRFVKWQAHGQQYSMLLKAI